VRGRETAYDVALRALRARDRSAAELEARLSEHGIGPDDRHEVLERLAGAGYVDDARVALARATELAGRGCGDALIRADLEQRGLGAVLVEQALATLEPEESRAERVILRRGDGHKTMRYLASRGFGEDVLETLVAREADGAIG
jgi:SOS response regulatory protein OraA/RecX